MLSSQQIDQFKSNGYLLIPNILQSSEIDTLRQDVATIFYTVHKQRAHPRDTAHHRFDIYNRYPAIKWLPYHPPIASILRSLMGDNYYTPQENLVAQKGFYSPWHKDTDYYELLDSYFHHDPRFCIVNIGIYLQDNHPEMAGGLDVIPQSHYISKTIEPLDMSTLPAEYLATHPPYSIPSKTGSIILFDQRIYHRATPPRKEPTIEKMALFWAVCANNELISDYYEIMKNLYGYKITGSLKFMAKYSQLAMNTKNLKAP